MANAYIGAGIAQGASDAFDYAASMPERNARREEAKYRAQLSKAKFQEYQQQAPLRDKQLEMQLAQTEQQTYQANRDLLNMRTFDAYNDVFKGGDYTRMNNMIKATKTNPQFASLYDDIARIDPLEDNEEVRKQLAQSGIKDVDGVLKNPEIGRNFAVATSPDGTKTVIDVTKGAMATGYHNYADIEQNKNLEKLATTSELLKRYTVTDINQRNMMAQYLVDNGAVDSLDVAKAMVYSPAQQSRTSIDVMKDLVAQAHPDWSKEQVAQEVLNLQSSKGRGFSSTELERAYEQYRQDTLSEGGQPMPIGQYKSEIWQPTAKTKDVEAASGIRSQLRERASQVVGNENFSYADMPALEEDPEFMDLRDDYLAQLGIKVDAKSNEAFATARQLAELSGSVSAGDTEKSTGLVDNLLGQAGSYTLANSGDEGKKAVQMMNKLVLKMLSGAAVSDQEREQFDTFAPNVKKQIGDILRSLKTVVLQPTKATVDQYMTSMDSTAAKLIAGTTKYKLQSALTNVADAIDRLDREMVVETGEDVPLPTNKPAGEKRSLDDIFGG